MAPPRSRTKAQASTSAPASPPVIGDLYTLAEFQDANARLWPSLESMRWFVRMHRAELVQAGAVVEIAGRVLVHGPRFMERALVIGQANMSRQLDRKTDAS